MNPLPPVIELLQLPESSGLEEQKRHEQKRHEPKARFVFCVSRDFIQQTQLLSQYGKVVKYDHTLYANLDPLSFDWDYLVLDHREKNDRYYHLRFIKPIEDQVNVLLFCHAIENQDLKNENHYDNVLNKLPEPQARKVDFDQLLLIERLPAPKWWWSLVKCLFKNYASAS